MQHAAVLDVVDSQKAELDRALMVRVIDRWAQRFGAPADIRPCRLSFSLLSSLTNCIGACQFTAKPESGPPSQQPQEADHDLAGSGDFLRADCAGACASGFFDWVALRRVARRVTQA